MHPPTSSAFLVAVGCQEWCRNLNYKRIIKNIEILIVILS